MSELHCKGAIFDLDGVLTDTARIHALAWEALFNEFLRAAAAREDKSFLPFDKQDDYRAYVDGKPRYQGVKSFLASRGYELPFGTPEDDPDAQTVCGLGNKKNSHFQELLQTEKPDVFPSSVAFVRTLKERGVRVAVASSSKNTALILAMTGLEELFEARVDGVVSQELGLKGKPDPDIFIKAAELLGLHPGECLVVEDAVSGVQAGRNGNFGLVLGLTRETDGLLLRRFGADLVVRDLAEIGLDDLEHWFTQGIEQDGWQLAYEGLDPGEEKLRETLCTVGNGYFGTRGAFENEQASFHFYPGTYLAGVFNKAVSQVHGREVVNNDFVNCPNWLRLEYRIGKGEFQSPLQQEILHHSRRLCMREAVLEWSLVCKDSLGRITRVHSWRLASMADPHVCALRYDITPLNYHDTITIRTGLDGNVTNDGVARYRALESRHLAGQAAGALHTPQGETTGIQLQMRTISSGYLIVMCQKTLLREQGRLVPVEKHLVRQDWYVGEEMSWRAEEGRTCSLEKLVAVHTSLDQAEHRDRGGSDPLQAARTTLERLKSWSGVYAPHARAWEKLWRKVDVRVEGDRFAQKVLRLHCYHLLVTASPHNVRLDAGLPARGLHGEAYRGHIFWDELYIMPFFEEHLPEVARALLLYRVRRLDAARRHAAEHGYPGAMYPWQTADDGGEETQEVHYNPESDSWGPDLSRRQRHVSIAVFYNLWRHVNHTRDFRFLREYGAEVMLEIARFWAGIAQKDTTTGRYHITGVMGPDEFHESLPGADYPGLRDNAYTNVMVVWLLERTLELLDTLPRELVAALCAKTGFSLEETDKWREMTRLLQVTLSPEGIISQFEGYFDLPELDWERYRKRYYSIQRMDRILKAEGDSPDNYKVAKQADALMLFYVLPPGEVLRILCQLGHEVQEPAEFLRRNYEYYVQRTSHGSTLSKVVHGVVAGHFESGPTVWNWFMESLRSDIFDTQGGTTTEGIHTGVMAGTIDMVFRHFAGIELDQATPRIAPRLPGHWRKLGLRFLHRTRWYDVELEQEGLRVKCDGRGGKPLTLEVYGRKVQLEPGRFVSVPRDAT